MPVEFLTEEQQLSYGRYAGNPGYQDFNSQPEHWRLVRWLYERIWHSAERPSLLFDLTTARLVQRKILLPGVTTLTRLIARIRERAHLRLWSTLAKLPTEKQQQNLEQLLIVPETAHQSDFERMRQSPTRLSAPSLVKALSRLEQIRALAIRQLNLSKIPPIRLHLLARYGLTSKAQILERMPRDRKIATLIAFVYILEEVATGDIFVCFCRNYFKLSLLEQQKRECL